jgi:four helix bundle protein
LNIAEGSAASSPVEFKRFLEISLRSDYELMCGIEISNRLGYCDSSEKDLLLVSLDEIAAMLAGFKKKLKADN